MKNPAPRGGFAFTKAPCAPDAPKSVLPEYSRDFLLTSFGVHFDLQNTPFIPVPFPKGLPLPRGPGIEYPPRTFLSLF